MVEIAHDIRPFDMAEATLCALLASYTFIIILDHDIWMKVSPSGALEGRPRVLVPSHRPFVACTRKSAGE